MTERRSELIYEELPSPTMIVRGVLYHVTIHMSFRGLSVEVTRRSRQKNLTFILVQWMNFSMNTRVSRVPLLVTGLAPDDVVDDRERLLRLIEYCERVWEKNKVGG